MMETELQEMLAAHVRTSDELNQALRWAAMWKRVAKHYRQKYRGRRRKIERQRKEIRRLERSRRGRREHIERQQATLDEVRRVLTKQENFLIQLSGHHPHLVPDDVYAEVGELLVELLGGL